MTYGYSLLNNLRNSVSILYNLNETKIIYNNHYCSWTKMTNYMVDFFSRKWHKWVLLILTDVDILYTNISWNIFHYPSSLNLPSRTFSRGVSYYYLKGRNFRGQKFLRNLFSRSKPPKNRSSRNLISRFASVFTAFFFKILRFFTKIRGN